jgi:hypothetical protein
MFWNEWRRKSIKRTTVQQGPWAVLPFVFLAACSTLHAADKVKDLQDRFDHESHATSKVKQLDKLGAAQFEAATAAGKQNDFATVAFTFEKYRDNVRTAFELLKKQEPDADRHPNGYRQLELQVRRGIREVEETLLIVPEEVRPPLRIVRQDLISMDDTLIHELFPRRTSEPQKVPTSPESKP